VSLNSLNCCARLLCTQVKANPWWVALIALVVAGVLAVVIMLAVCSTTFCAGVPLYKGGDSGQVP
jgi:hypothetical protein